VDTSEISNKGKEYVDLHATRYWMHSSLAQSLIPQKQLFQVTQFPGDTMCIPHNWYHATLSLADSVSVSREFCTFMNTNHRIQPLGAALYGGRDEFRGLGQVNMLSAERMQNREIWRQRERRLKALGKHRQAISADDTFSVEGAKLTV
jgi:hypothetical protein